MCIENDWLNTGQLENGLQVWEKEYTESNVPYLKLEYRDHNGNRVGGSEVIPVTQIRLHSAVLESIEIEYGKRIV
ncbi:hypothetical protein [Paenibacillus sp. RU5A]|uniref:hypothetical protein n=1 Tax=Paenibacillus sp. RU5A TaxID=1938794 RepID=UPI0009A75720|nr:hypothetical protein [Paenibacillus sp. RU5A]SLK16063.1 hypothetical protein SAMN06272722_11067 [Paenibacillus sp. RU5A]SOC74190.1 hypothetical protein SAMN05880581_11067 [Paenibacillus sp. RU26A]SOC76339.1 hypothetical protein SAMN05880586_11067 [Paenibacillus sp. RU5M]